jgi:hypothetical protein
MSKQTMIGAKRLPPPGVLPSDRCTEPSGWFAQRAGASADSPEVLERRAIQEARRKEREEAKERRALELEARWDASTHRTAPFYLRNSKPITREPWAVDAMVYANKTGSFEDVMNDDEPYNDESALDSNNGYVSEVTATGLSKTSALGESSGWDSSPFRHRPPTLRGCVPAATSREPWQHDEVKNKSIYREWMGKRYGPEYDRVKNKPHMDGQTEGQRQRRHHQSTGEKMPPQGWNWSLGGGWSWNVSKILLTPWRGKGEPRVPDPQDVGSKEADPDSPFRTDVLTSWRKWADDMNLAC